MTKIRASLRPTRLPCQRLVRRRKIGALLSGSYQKRKDELKAATTDGWIVNGGTPLRRSRVAPGCKKTASNPPG